MSNKVRIRRLGTGVPGLDTVLGGGLPELSFNLIAGGPGCGKTTLAHQFVFANATETQTALYFTIFGEPAIKMLRYQQQFEFFEASKVGAAIRFVHLGKEMIDGGLDMVMERITQEIAATEARFVVVDSFRSIARSVATAGARVEQMDLERFVQLLALVLTTYEATTFLIGEYSEQERNSNPVFTVADGILWLSQVVVHNSAVRRVQAMKMRGAAPVPGLHTIKLTDHGLRVYPRLSKPDERTVVSGPGQKKKTGVPGLDAMLGGGIPEGYSMLVVGPSGSGKSMLATQFILEGVRAGETAVLAVFEKRPDEYLRTVPAGPGARAADRRRQDEARLHPSPGSVRGRSTRGASGSDHPSGGEARRHRLALGLRARPRVPLSRGVPRVALPDGRRPHEPGRDADPHRRADRVVYGDASERAGHFVSDRRDHLAALCRDRRLAAQGDDGRQDARERPCQGVS